MAETLAPYTTDESVCPKCKGAGGFDRIINGLDFWIICECRNRQQEQKKLLQLFDSAKIPKRYMFKSLDNFDRSRQPKAFKKAEDYLQNWDGLSRAGKGLIFAGDVGTGKTHLAYAVMLFSAYLRGIETPSIHLQQPSSFPVSSLPKRN